MWHTADTGVTAAWTGVNMSTPLCPEGVPEVDADPPSLDSSCLKGVGTAYPQTLPSTGRGRPSPHSTDIVHPTLLDPWRRS